MTQADSNTRFTPLKRFLILVFVTCACFLVCLGLTAVITYKGITPGRMRLATLTQSVIVFLLPALLTALMVTYKPWRFMRLDAFKAGPCVLGILGLIVAVPAMNSIVAWNESLPAPEWMRVAEEQARQAVDFVLGGTSAGDLVVCLLIVGIMPGVAEEFFFRGALQRLIATTPPVGHHAAIWITAFIFSAMHMQFLGFFPRLLLGAYFGYLMYWSGSLWIPVIIHSLNNSLVVLSSWLSRAGYTSFNFDDAQTFAWPVVTLSVIFTILVLVGLARSGRLKPER